MALLDSVCECTEYDLYSITGESSVSTSSTQGFVCLVGRKDTMDVVCIAGKNMLTRKVLATIDALALMAGKSQLWAQVKNPIIEKRMERLGFK
jgi:hypothetical protein